MKNLKLSGNAIIIDPAYLFDEGGHDAWVSFIAEFAANGAESVQDVPAIVMRPYWGAGVYAALADHGQGEEFSIDSGILAVFGEDEYLAKHPTGLDSVPVDSYARLKVDGDVSLVGGVLEGAISIECLEAGAV